MNGVDKDAGSSQPRLPLAVCVGSYLSVSETFIYDQLLHARQTRPWVLARTLARSHTLFPYEDVVALGAPEWLAYYYAGISPTAQRELARRRPRLIHAHFGLNGTMVLPLARRLGIPLVVSFHGHDVGGLEPQNRWTFRYHRYQRLAPQLFEYATLLLCASTELQQLLAIRGAPEHKLVVHHLGVDTQVFRPPPEGRREPIVLMVGRLVEKKGMEYGLRAFAEVARPRPELRLVIVGQGPLSSALQGLARQLGVAERVEFLGARPAAEVREQMARAQLLMTPSVTTASGDRESGVIVIKEAGAMGLPTLATQHGGIPEIVDDGVNGYLVPERDVSALAMRLSQLLDSGALREQQGVAARRLVQERYDTRVQNARLESHLLRAAGWPAEKAE